MTDLLVASDGSENVTGLDLSDFPALADRSRREGTGNPTPVLNPLAGRAPYGRPLVWRKNLIVPKQNAFQGRGRISTCHLQVSSFSTLQGKLEHNFLLTAFM